MHPNSCTLVIFPYISSNKCALCINANWGIPDSTCLHLASNKLHHYEYFTKNITLQNIRALVLFLTFCNSFMIYPSFLHGSILFYRKKHQKYMKPLSFLCLSAFENINSRMLMQLVTFNMTDLI